MRMLSLSALLLSSVAIAQFTQGSLEKNLEKLGCHSVLVVNSKTIRDPIHWSPDSKSIGVKVDGRWVRIDLDALVLKTFRWRNDQPIAVPASKLEFPTLPDTDRKAWSSSDEENSRSVRTSAGTLVELPKLDGGGVALMVFTADGSTREVWKTKLEDCQGLVLSPDQRWVAFICGLHGVVVMKVP